MWKKLFRLICILSVFVFVLFGATPALLAEEDVTEASKDTDTARENDPESEGSQVFMNIGDMTVHAAKPIKRCADLPGSVDVIGKDEVEKQEANTALDILRIVPGFAIGDYNSGGVPNGFTMRGFGMGGHGKHTLVTIDGIPYNAPFGATDGAVDLNQLSVNDVESIEVVKGPIDARYGNWSRAGVIHFHTRQRGDFSTAKLASGSFGTQKAFVSLGNEQADGKFNQVYAVEYFDTDGYRENNDYSRQNAYGKWFYRPGTDLQIGAILHAYSSDWNSAGYLTEEEWKEDPKNSIHEQDGGYKDLTEMQVHVDWEINDHMPLAFKLWFMDEDYSRFSNYGTSDADQTESHFETQTIGALANLGYDVDMAGSRMVRLDVGFDYRNYDTKEDRYNTEYRHRDDQTKDNDYTLSNLGFYAKANYDPLEMLRLFGGLRYDTFDGDFTDNIEDVTSDVQNYDIWTYSGGLILTFLQGYSFYANAGTGFQLPQNDAKFGEDAPDASEFYQYEVGFKASPVEQVMVRYAYFDSTNEDEITGSYNAANNEWTYSLEGGTHRTGHEIELNLMPLKNLQFFGAYTLQEAKYEEGAKSGNWLAAVPEYILKVGAEYILPFGTALRCWYNDVGKWYTRSDNTTDYDGYQVFDFKISHPIADQWTVSFDAKNLFDEDYSEYVSNWSGSNQYAGSNGQYFQVTLKYEM